MIDNRIPCLHCGHPVYIDQTGHRCKQRAEIEAMCKAPFCGETSMPHDRFCLVHSDRRADGSASGRLIKSVKVKTRGEK